MSFIECIWFVLDILCNVVGNLKQYDMELNKKLNAYEGKMSKIDWRRLYKHGLVDCVGGNGFSSTTKLIDDNIIISSFSPTVIEHKGHIYSVQYHSGCFYPIWAKLFRVGGGYIKSNKCYSIDSKGNVDRIAENEI